MSSDSSPVSAAAAAALAAVSDEVTIGDDFFTTNTPTQKAYVVGAALLFSPCMCRARASHLPHHLLFSTAPLPFRSYTSDAFLNSSAARSIRILCEYEEPKQRLEAALDGQLNTVLFFASARGKKRADHDKAVVEAQAELEALPADASASERARVEDWIVRLGRLEWQCDFYEKVRELSRAVAQWGVDRIADGRPRVSICSGGGPGLMAAANQGAHDVPGAKSIGMAISLPFEKGCNPYVDDDLAFEFHYFFTRKVRRERRAQRA